MELEETLPFDPTHSAWITAGGTIVGYGIVLALLFLAMFVVPYLVFAAL